MEDLLQMTINTAFRALIRKQFSIPNDKEIKIIIPTGNVVVEIVDKKTKEKVGKYEIESEEFRKYLEV